MPSRRRRTSENAAEPAGTRVAAAPPEPAKVVSLDKVTAVRRRIANGYYERDEVRDRLALAVLEELRKG